MGFVADQIADMLTEKGLSGRQFLSATHRAVSHREHLIVVPIDSDDRCDVLATWCEGDTSVQSGVAIECRNINDFEMIKDNHVACIDADKIKYPLVLRRWRQGDTFVPFGMKGRKKVSDYFSDRKYSLIDKEKALILCDAEKIVWIVSERSSNETRVTNATQHVLIVRCDVCNGEI
jgi:tRNA(Ile)-lysidine synthase